MEFNSRICHPLFRVFADDGVRPSLYVYGGHQRHQSLGWVLCTRAQYDRLLELDYRLA